MSAGFADILDGVDPHAEPAKANGGGEPLPSIDPIDLTSLPEEEPSRRMFLVEGWLPMPCLSSLYGPGGIGKSLIAQQLATCIVAGVPFLGAEVMRSPVLALFGEDDDEELKRRQWRINQAMGLCFADLGTLHLCGRAGIDNMLVAFPGGAPEVTPLFDAIVAKAKSLGARLVILDNRAQMFIGDENDRAVATYSANTAARIARDIDGACLLLGHDRKSDDTYSGSTAWDAVTRSRWQMSRTPGDDPDDDFLTLARVKNNYARPEVVTLAWRGGVLVANDPEHMTAADVLAARMRDGAAEQAFLDALDILTAQGRACSDSKHARDTYAPRFMKSEGLAEGFSVAELEGAMRRLFAAERIEANVPLGKGKDRHPRFGIGRKGT